MSNVASPSGSQTPLEETLDRVAESVGPSLGINRLQGLLTQLNVVNDARARTKDSHAAQMRQLYKVMGEEMPQLADGDEMAGISVQGDTVYNVTPPPATEPNKLSTLAKLGVGAALVASGAGLPLAGLGIASLLGGANPPAAVDPVTTPANPPAPSVDRDTYLPYEFSIE